MLDTEWGRMLSWQVVYALVRSINSKVSELRRLWKNIEVTIIVRHRSLGID